MISGPRAGEPFRSVDLEDARAAVPEIPVIANTGIRHDTPERIHETADAIVVGTSLKVDARTANRIDPARARQMVELTRSARAHHLERR
jgi:uncharacterized protein